MQAGFYFFQVGLAGGVGQLQRIGFHVKQLHRRTAWKQHVNRMPCVANRSMFGVFACPPRRSASRKVQSSARTKALFGFAARTANPCHSNNKWRVRFIESAETQPEVFQAGR